MFLQKGIFHNRVYNIETSIRLEGMYCESKYVQQIYIHGNSDQDFLIAVVVLHSIKNKQNKNKQTVFDLYR